MNKTLKSTLVALVMTGATLTSLAMIDVSTAHAADVGVSFDLGAVAIGYNDGYWDHDHHWHKWQNASHRKAYQHADGAEYHATPHTRAENQGWHEREEHHDDHH